MPTETSRQVDSRAPRSRWWLPILLFLVILAAVGGTTLLIGQGRSPAENGSYLTHTLSRGDVVVSVTEQGTLESSDNVEVKCKVRGQSTVTWVVEGGAEVQPGDEVVRLDTLALEDAISERTKYAHLSRSGAERSRADVAVAKLAISEYLEGTYRSELNTMNKDLAIFESNLRTAKNMLIHAEMLAERGYVSELDLDRRRFNVERAELNLDVQKTQIDVLTTYRKKMELERLNGELEAAKAKLAADEERAKQDEARRALAVEELEYCVMHAERSGMVIYPPHQPWENVPDMEEGATVHQDQVLLLMPDLTKMQVKVGIHESVIERVRPGLEAIVTLPDEIFHGHVSEVSPVTRPAGWWTGNVVKYDTIVQLPETRGLRPGMSADVEVILQRHEDVLTIPTAAVLETREGDFCWVETEEGLQRRSLQLGDTDDVFIVVLDGVKEGEAVVLDPLASVADAQTLALKPLDEFDPRAADADEVLSPDEPTADRRTENGD